MFGLPPILAHLAELVSLALVSSVAVGVGLRLLGLLRLMPPAPFRGRVGVGDNLPPPFRGRAGVGGLSLGERLLFSFALGYGALAYATFALGLLGLLYAPLVLALLLLFAAIGFRLLFDTLHEAIPALRPAIISLRYPPNLFLALIILVTIAANLTRALVPPITQDDVMYHLALPARYVQQHAVAFYPDSSYSLFPQMMEMLYGVGLLFGSDRLALLFAFALGLLGPVAAVLFAKRYLGGDGQGVWRALPLLTAALYLTSPLIAFTTRAANTDPPQASFDLLAAYAAWLAITNLTSAEDVVNHAPTDARTDLDHSMASNQGVMNHTPTEAQSYQAASESSKLKTQHSALILSGCCAGLALAVKYNGFAVGLAIGVALVAIILYRRLSLGSGVRLLLAYGLPIVLLILPWLVRNWLASGNPIWPLASAVFGGSYSSVANPASYLLGSAPPIGLASLGTAWDFLIASLTQPPILVDRVLQVVSLGPLLLPLLPALLLAKWRAGLRWFVYLTVAYWLIFALFLSRTSARYLITMLLFSAILSAGAVVSLTSRHRLLQALFAGLLGITLTLLVLENALGTGDYLPTAFAISATAERQYVATYMEDDSLIQYIAANTPLTATIYVWDSQPRGYYLPRRYIYARLVPLYSDFGDTNAPRWRARLGELGINYILYHPRIPLTHGLPVGYDPYADAAKQFIAQYFGPPLFQSGSYTLYPLR